MADRKLILPAELRLCATCAYWDGERKLDEELRLVVVAERCQGECLVREASMPGLSAARHCLWEELCGDEPTND